MQLFIHPCVIEKALHQDCQWCCFHLRFTTVISCQDRPILSLRLQMEAVIEKRPGVPQGAILLHIHFAGGSAATKFPVSHLNMNTLSLYMQSPNSTWLMLLVGTLICTAQNKSSAICATVYPKKYAHGFCFVVLCCGYTLTDFPISTRLTSLALWQSNDCPSASKATLMNMDKYFMWIHYERLHNHNKAKHNKTVCIFLWIYCTATWGVTTQWMKLPAMTKLLTKLDVCIFHYYFKSLTAISN